MSTDAPTVHLAALLSEIAYIDFPGAETGYPGDSLAVDANFGTALLGSGVPVSLVNTLVANFTLEAFQDDEFNGFSAIILRAKGTGQLLLAVRGTSGLIDGLLTLTGSSAINGTGNTLNNVLIGNSAINTLTGGTGNDDLTGGAGNDALNGGDGADRYFFASGDGSDTINNSSADAAVDRLVFTDRARTALTFARSGNDLLVTRSGVPADSVRVTNWFTVPANQIDFVETTGGVVTTAADINALIAGGGSGFLSKVSAPTVAALDAPADLSGTLQVMLYPGLITDVAVMDVAAPAADGVSVIALDWPGAVEPISPWVATDALLGEHLLQASDLDVGAEYDAPVAICSTTSSLTAPWISRVASLTPRSSRFARSL
mgnify:CR=1 FL=1